MTATLVRPTAPPSESAPDLRSPRGTSQIDGVRGIAILLVLIHHFFHLSHPVGNIGVRLFFGISGFLITGVLLNARKHIETCSSSLSRVVTTFYLRRALRLLPALYVVLAGAWVMNIRPARETILWHVGGATNVLMVMLNDFIGPLTHLWSLAAEAQFYVVWPLLMLLTPRRWLGGMIVGLIVAAPVFRLTAWLCGAPMMWYVVTPFALTDCVCMGALAAWLNQQGAHGTVRLLRKVGLVVGVAVVVVASCFYTTSSSLTKLLAFDCAMALVALGMVTGASTGFGGLFGAALSFRPLALLGKASYGLYLLHNFVPLALNNYWPSLQATPTVKYTLMFTLSIAAAMLSWYFLEKPINDLKHHFPYRATTSPVQSARLTRSE